MMKRLLPWLPFILVGGLFLAFWAGLRSPDDHIIASRMVGQPLPQFETQAVVPGQPPARSADFHQGKPRLLNVFASWCVPCAREAPTLLRLKAAGADIEGIAVHDNPADLARFLGENGNPYRTLGIDMAGRAQMAFGSTGVPETFVVDGRGQIIHQHIGVVEDGDVPMLLAKLGIAP